MPFGNDFFGGNEPNRRDQLEIGEDGKTTANRKQKKRERQQQEYGEMGKGGGYGGRGRFGRMRDRFSRGNRQGGRGRMGGSRDNPFITFLIGLAMIGVPIAVVVMLFTGNLGGGWRSFLTTSEQNQTAFFQGVFDTQQTLHDSFLSDEEKEQVEIYRKNEISKLDFIKKQVYPEYVVYVYSSSEEKNKPYNEFIMEAEDKGSTFPVPIFRISADLTRNYFVTDTIGENEPAFLIYRNNTGNVEYDSALNDPKQFSKLGEYMEEIIKEDDEYFKNRTGEYGDAEWMQRLGETSEEE